MPKKESYATKCMYVLPKTSQPYVAIVQTLEMLNSTEYLIMKVRNLYKYLSRHKNDNLFILKYYIIDDFDLSIFDDYNNINSYTFEKENIIYETIEKKYNNFGVTPRLNFTKNKNIFCSNCKFLPKTIDELSKHLRECETFFYTLFDKDIPSHILVSKKIVNNNTTNNINITNNYQFNISVRQVGDFLRKKLSDEEKIRILNSMDKLGEMVKTHFTFPEINRTLTVKNSNMYTGHSICFNGKEFVTKPNRDVFEYYIMDLLDSCDYFAYDFKKAEYFEKPEIDRLIENLDKYDSNIRKNDKHMRQKIQTTIAQVKSLQGNIK